MAQLTPYSTVGPFFKLLVRDRPEGIDSLVTGDARGQRITIEGTLLDGAAEPVLDGLVEIWQADAQGCYRHPADPRAGSVDPAFTGSGRVSTGVEGKFAFHTIRPGMVPAFAKASASARSPAADESAGKPGEYQQMQAPHVLVSVLARGIMTRCWTRMYFEDEEANRTDPILQLVPANRRDTLIARRIGDGRYRFDIILQGERETAFFEA
jgi:protocatechuate 3,4-dioxygenase alpha subunit